MARSRQDLCNLGKISSISARSLQSRWDLSKNFARAGAGMNFKSWDRNVIYSSLSCVLDRVLICCLRDSMMFVFNRGVLWNFVEWQYLEWPGNLFLSEIIFWLKLNNYVCWMKIIWVEVKQILLLNEIIYGWSWIIIVVEWNYFWLKLNKYFYWMKIIWVEVERKCVLLNININVEYKYILLNINISCWIWMSKFLNFATFG